MKVAIKRVAWVLFIIIILLSNSTVVYALEKQGTDSKGSYTVKDSRHYPIIFIPGMAGSTLDVGGTTPNAWPGSFSDEDLASIGNWPLSTAIQYLVTGELGIKNDEAFKVLALKKDGKSPVSGPRVLPTGTVRYGAGDVYGIAGYKITGDFRMAPIYQGFYDYMEAQGYKLDENPTGKVFFDFPYDFRQDNRRWTELLDKKIDTVLKLTKSDKVILVGHSMGGLQARLYMKDEKRAEKVAAVVFMGTPHHGAPMAFYSFTEGYNFGNVKLSDARMWEIAANWEGGYQLMPDYPFIKDADDMSKPPVGIEAMLNKNWISSQEYERYLQAQSEGKKYKINKGFPNNDFASRSMDFHKELGDSVDKYPGVKYYMIRGTAQETVEYLVARWTAVEGLPEGLIRFEKQMSPGKLGDGTVPLQGALVKGLDAEYEVNSEHGAIPSNAEAQAILTGIRKDINNEEFRNSLVDKITAVAGVKLAEFKSGGYGGGSLSFGDWWAMLFGGPRDEEKQELKKEIRNLALSVINNSRVNITITAAEGEVDKDKEEHLYLVIKNLELKECGTGIISGANISVIVDSYHTFEEVLKNPDDSRALVNAYKSGAITVKGGGFVNMLIARLLEWYKKYI